MQAAQVVDAVVSKGMSLNDALTIIPETLSKEDTGFVKALSFGTLRFYHRLECHLDALLNKPIRNKDRIVKMLALIGLYQLSNTRVPSHAAVSETVNALSRQSWAKGLLNAVLRNFQRRQAELESLADRSLQTRTSHPQWLVQTIQQSWLDQADEVLKNNNRQAPMVIRVNRLQGQREDYLLKLEQTGITAHASNISLDGIVLDKPVDVTALPDFSEGAVYVQDTAAQLAAQLLSVEPGQRVADLCSAPGGKAIHVLERYPDLNQLVALDTDPQRTEMIRVNAQRCRVNPQIKCVDATDLEQWWDGSQFDRVMLDVPCSGTGVIRRHPDIKLLRKPEDIDSLVQRQQDLLETAWSILAPGGVLLYSTCSLLNEENADQIKRFLSIHDNAELWPINLFDGLRETDSTGPGLRIATGLHEMDGFYYARLKKTQ
ncbi:MAG: 16S rRNA (cytosine(967)-C(5))-methyltransferase RsmB [Gammaproteobacteria bacterium]|nr:16S rRNA (cytosine(967)-C(5))-methyltransferase RsmB [Gammaproteobacteria bacterium]